MKSNQINFNKYYELSIEYPIIFEQIFKDFCVKTKQEKFCKDGSELENKIGVCICKNGELLIAVEKQDEPVLLNKLKVFLIEFFAKFFKKTYFENKLENLEIEKDKKQIFLQAICLFDEENDRLLLQRFLQFDNKLLLNEFFYFRLKLLKKKWDDIVKMVMENKSFFTSENFMYEIIRFLLSNVKTKCNFLSLEQEKDAITIQNEQQQTVFFEKCDNNQISVECLLYIMQNFPKRLYVKNFENLDKDSKDKLYLIFKNFIKPLYLT